MKVTLWRVTSVRLRSDYLRCRLCSKKKRLVVHTLLISINQDKICKTTISHLDTTWHAMRFALQQGLSNIGISWLSLKYFLHINVTLYFLFRYILENVNFKWEIKKNPNFLYVNTSLLKVKKKTWGRGCLSPTVSVSDWPIKLKTMLFKDFVIWLSHNSIP